MIISAAPFTFATTQREEDKLVYLIPIKFDLQTKDEISLDGCVLHEYKNLTLDKDFRYKQGQIYLCDEKQTPIGKNESFRLKKGIKPLYLAVITKQKSVENSQLLTRFTLGFNNLTGSIKVDLEIKFSTNEEGDLLSVDSLTVSQNGRKAVLSFALFMIFVGLLTNWALRLGDVQFMLIDPEKINYAIGAIVSWLGLQPSLVKLIVSKPSYMINFVRIPQLYLTPSVFSILNKKVTNYMLMAVLPGAVWLLSAYFTPHELEKLPDSCHCQYYFQTKDDLHLVEQREKIQILNSDLNKVKISFKDLDVNEIDTLSFSFGSLTNPNLKSNFLTQLGLREYRVKPAYVTYEVIHESGSELKPIDFKRPDLDYSVVQSVKAYVTGKHSDITIDDSGSVITVASELKPKIQLRDFNTIFHEITRAFDSEENGAENYVKNYFIAKIDDYSLEDEVIFEAYKSLVKIHLDPLQGKGEQTKANKFEIMRPIVEVLIEKSSLETKKRIIGELLAFFEGNYHNKIKDETNKFYYRLQVGLLVYADAKFPALRNQVERGIHDVIKDTGRIWYRIYLEEIADQGSEISEVRKSFFSSIGVFRLITRSEFEAIRNNENSRESVRQFIDDYISLNSIS